MGIKFFKQEKLIKGELDYLFEKDWIFSLSSSSSATTKNKHTINENLNTNENIVFQITNANYINKENNENITISSNINKRKRFFKILSHSEDITEDAQYSIKTLLKKEVSNSIDISESNLFIKKCRYLINENLSLDESVIGFLDKPIFNNCKNKIYAKVKYNIDNTMKSRETSVSYSIEGYKEDDGVIIYG